MTATRSMSASLQQLSRTLTAEELADAPDAELVGRFVERRDEFAFATLVRRYGPVVFGVCRRVLRHEQDAEDAFQATFLVFARDAAGVQRAGALGNWLYGVAHNVARKARASRLRREAKELEAASHRQRDTPAAVVDDLKEILDGELGALPDKYRAPIVLCDLMGLTTQQAAAEVGCPPKTLGTRLSRARSLLARRLTRRGLALSAGVLATSMAPQATAAVPARLLEGTVQAATGLTTATPAVTALTTGVSMSVAYTSLKYALLACGLLAAGGTFIAPVMQYLHAAHAPKKSSTSTTNGTPGQPEHASPAAQAPSDPHAKLHSFIRSLIHGEFFTSADAAEAKDDEQKALSGVWMKKEGEVKLTFEKGELKISPHNKDDIILIVCEYKHDKDGVVKAKVTSLEGLKKAALAEKFPVGTEFSFKWKVNKDSAGLDEVKGEKAELLKSHLEGEFEEKK